MRVLYVDDDRVNALLFSEACRLAPGVDVDTADSGEEALERIRARVPELLVIDLHLPDTDGFALLARLREAAGHEVPAFLCTADDEAGVAVRAREAGFTGCWSKPLDLQPLIAELTRRAGGPARA